MPQSMTKKTRLVGVLLCILCLATATTPESPVGGVDDVTAAPTTYPTLSPTLYPTVTHAPTSSATDASPGPIANMSNSTAHPTTYPTSLPTIYPTSHPSLHPTLHPTTYPTASPTPYSTETPTTLPTSPPTVVPTAAVNATSSPTVSPSTTVNATSTPTVLPTFLPTAAPSSIPTAFPSQSPTLTPSAVPTQRPTAAPTPHPSPRPTHRPTRLPTPHPEAGSTWWYSTQAFVSVKWHPELEEEGEDGEIQGPDDLVAGLDRGFYAALQQLLDWDSQGMSTEVVEGSKDIFEEERMGTRGRLRNEGQGHRHLLWHPATSSGPEVRRLSRLAVWNSFTLGVWTTAPGSLGEVAAALDLIMNNQSILLDLILAEGDFTTVSELLLHEITPGVTTRPPPGVDSPEQDSASIALIIVWTLVVFLLLLLAVSLMKARCCGGEGRSKADPFTYKAPSESLFGRMKGHGGSVGKRGQGFGRLSEMELPNSTHSNSSAAATSSNPLHGGQREDHFAY